MSLLLVFQRQQLESKAFRPLSQKGPEKEEISQPISEWVPIDVSDFNAQTDKRVSELNNEIALIQQQKLPLDTEAKRLDPLKRELQIQQINKEEYNLMDEDKDGKISYQEFNKRDFILAGKIYKLRHTTISNLPNGLYDENLTRITDQNRNNYSSPTTNLFRVFIEAGIYQALLPSLRQYRIDVTNEWGYNVQFFLCNNCSKEEIKDLLKVRGTSGTVFVGNLPVAWYKGVFWNERIIEIFPIDLYFMDLDGTWGGEVYCGEFGICFTSHTGERYPEIFFGRLATPSEAEETRLLIHYFNKNHAYRTGGHTLAHRSLNYGDISWEEATRDFPHDPSMVKYVYPNYETVANPTSTMDDYINRFYTQNYEFSILIGHGNPQGIYFSADGSYFF